MKNVLVALGAVALVLPATASAAPGLGDEVYGATVDKGELELEARYGRLGGGPDDSEDALKLEAGYGVTHNLRLAAVAEFEKEPGLPREAEAISAEVIWAFGKVGGIDVAAYAEYEIGLHGPDKAETKLLLQRKTGAWDLRLNLIGEKPLVDGAPVELGYAASFDVAATEGVRVGAQAFGELGTFSNFAPRAQHYIGPVAKFEIEGLGPEEVGLEIGYLFALGKAKDDADGQLRVKLEMEF